MASPWGCFDDLVVRNACVTDRSLSFIFITVQGILKGFDQLINLVLDESKEMIRGKITDRCSRPCTVLDRDVFLRETETKPKSFCGILAVVD